MEQLDQAVARGVHPSAQSDDKVIEALWAEAREQEEAGYATIIPWATLREHAPPRLKVSPVAAIPHKARLVRKILDLSFALKGTGTAPVNEATDPT